MSINTTDNLIRIQSAILTELDGGNACPDEATMNEIFRGPDGERIEAHRVPNSGALVSFEAYNEGGRICWQIDWTGGEGNTPVQATHAARELLEAIS